MAIYHFSAKLISRSQGRSSVAASAYRAAEKLIDERTELTHDFTHKNDVVDKAILLPDDAPDWIANREQLWNAVEHTEKRKDAQLAREINVALPRELTPEQNWELLTSFVKEEFVAHGMVADVTFHSGHKGGEEQPHGHIMLSLREVTPEGFGQKVRAWNDKALLQHWRERWGEYVNLGLAREGLDLRVDHRTLEAQGIHLEPQSKIGPKVAQKAMARFAEHQALAERNGERLLKEPEIALAALTRQQSTFTHHDIARFVNRHTIDSTQFDAVYAKVKTHLDIVHVGFDEKQQARFTTREMLQLETKLLNQATEKAQLMHHPVSEAHLLQAKGNKNLSDEQAIALDHLVQGQDMACVVGYAGTGKSYMLGAAREAWEMEGYRVHGMTLSGIAAENLEGGSGIQSHTVASRLWHWERDRERLTSKDIVVVDEAGMLGSRQLAKILDEAHKAKAKVVLVGDPEQLQAIEAGAIFRAIAERTGFVEMTEIRRQQVPWQQQATRDMASQATEKALMAYERHDNVHTFTTKAQAITGMLEQWDEVRSQAPDKSQLMLAYTRDEVKSLNEQARAMRHAQGELGKDHVIETSRGERNFAEGDRIYFLRNENRTLHVKNGTIGTIEKIEHDKLTVRLDKRDGENTLHVQFSLKDYNDIDHGYAATVYKAQGVTVHRAHVLASPYFDRHSTYVAMSRHKEGVDLYVNKEEFPSFAKLSQTLSREKMKDVSLDYFGTEKPIMAVDRSPTIDKKHESSLTGTPYASSFTQMPTDATKSSLDNAMRNALAQEKQRTPLAYQQDFAAFKAQFEREHPTEAAAIHAATRSPQEKRALEIKNDIASLEKKYHDKTEHGFQRELERYAAKLKNEPLVMAHLRLKEPALFNKLELLAKSHERHQSCERSRGMSRGDFGF